MSNYDVMDQGGSQVSSRHYFAQNSPFLDRVPLSWVAYVRVWKVFFAGLMLAGVFALIGMWLQKEWLVFIGMAYMILWVVYEVAMVRSTYLFTDPAGVWVFSGVFPWQKGFHGIPWRQIGGAGYQRGFFSWLSKSYRIDVSDRFKESSGFALADLKYGDLVVTHINQTVVGIN